jgi:hypothetical protein
MTLLDAFSPQNGYESFGRQYGIGCNKYLRADNYFFMCVPTSFGVEAAKSGVSFASRHEIPICSLSPMLLQDSYDIVVIGAGAAGSIVSAKLSTSLNMSALLVEAGVETSNDDNDSIANPANWLNVLHNDTLEWHFQTVSQTALNKRTLNLGFAKGTGGSTMHNAMG